MKIVYIIQNLMHGGAEMQLLSVAEAQLKLGNKVKIITLFEPEDYFYNKLDQLKIELNSFNLTGIGRLPSTIIGIRKILKEFRPDIVHSHMYHSNVIARLIYPIYRPPKYVCTAHNVREGGALRDWVYRLTDSFCDVTTNVSQAAVDRYNRDGLVRKSRCILVQNGIDMERFQFRKHVRALYRKEFNLAGQFAWLAVASLTEQKDFPNLLRAFALLVNKGKYPAHLFIAGSGRLESIIRKMIVELNLSERVSLLGPRNDVDSLCSMADGYVMSSAWEGLPIVLLEAASCQLPAVVTDVGGNREIVCNNENGFVVPAKNAEVLAGKMLEMMTMDEERRRAFGVAAREHIKKRYSIESTAKKWVSLYKSLLS